MIRLVFAVPGELATPTGGYAYARRLLAALPNHGVAAEVLVLPGGFPDPSTAEIAATGHAFAASGGGPLLVDGLALGAIPAAVLAPFRERLIALVHHPLGYETGLAPPRRQALIESERDALSLARAVIASSTTTAVALIEDFGVPAARITVAEPGTDPRPRAMGRGDPPRLLAVGAVTPRKGYDLLVAALARIADRPWVATIVGSLHRDPGTAAELARAILAAGLENRITLTGAVEDAVLDAHYHAADVFLAPSHYEGYGMAVAEALARGLPIVATAGGALAATVPDAAGLKVPPADPDALAAAIAGLLDDPARRRTLADAAARHAATLPRWSETAARVAAVVRAVAR